MWFYLAVGVIGLISIQKQVTLKPEEKLPDVVNISPVIYILQGKILMDLDLTPLLH